MNTIQRNKAWERHAEWLKSRARTGDRAAIAALAKHVAAMERRVNERTTESESRLAEFSEIVKV